MDRNIVYILWYLVPNNHKFSIVLHQNKMEANMHNIHLFRYTGILAISSYIFDSIYSYSSWWHIKNKILFHHISSKIHLCSHISHLILKYNLGHIQRNVLCLKPNSLVIYKSCIWGHILHCSSGILQGSKLDIHQYYKID